MTSLSPRFFPTALPLGAFILVAAASSGSASPTVSLTVHPAQPETHVNWASLGFDPARHAAVTIAGPPLHGTVEVQQGLVTYRPEPGFWSLGTDTYNYGLQPISGREKVITGMVTLIAQKHSGTSTLLEGFEGGQLPVTGAVQDPGQRLRVASEGAIAGAYGVVVEGVPPGSAAYISYDVSVPPNGGNQGSQIRMGIDPPPIGTGSGGGRGAGRGLTTGAVSPSQAIILGAFTAEDEPIFQVSFRTGEQGADLRLELFEEGNVASTTPWRSIDEFAQEIVINWWKQGQAEARLMFWVDDLYVAQLPWTLQASLTDEITYRFGILQSIGPAPMGLTFDELWIEDGVAAPYLAVDRSDTFEDTLTTWDLIDSGDDIALTLQAALTGLSGMERRFGPGRGVDAAVVDLSPAGTPTQSFRFRIDPSQVLLSNDVVQIFGGTADPSYVTVAGDSGETLRVWLRESLWGVGYEILAEAKDSGTSWGGTGWIPIPSGEQLVELVWRAANTPDTYDGHLRLWLDGHLAARVEGLGNAGATVDAARLGGLGADPWSTGGQLFFDDYLAWRRLP